MLDECTVLSKQLLPRTIDKYATFLTSADREIRLGLSFGNSENAIFRFKASFGLCDSLRSQSCVASHAIFWNVTRTVIRSGSHPTLLLFSLWSPLLRLDTDVLCGLSLGQKACENISQSVE